MPKLIHTIGKASFVFLYLLHGLVSILAYMAFCSGAQANVDGICRLPAIFCGFLATWMPTKKSSTFFFILFFKL
jgi:hypothetical protein